MRRAIVIGFAVALFGFLGGRISAGSESAPAPPDPGSPGPTRYVSGGVGVGFAHTRAGAVAASAHYQRALADPTILSPRGLRSRVEAVATPDYAPAMIEANRLGSRRIANGPLGDGLRANLGTTFLGVPVSYRVLSYSPDRAVIRTWGFTIVGNVSTVEPVAFFGLSKVELAWSEGDWKIASTKGSFGPTPRLGTPRAGGEGFAVADLLEEMRSYAVGP